MKKVFSFLSYFLIGILILFIWHILSVKEIVPHFMLPTPLDVAKAFFENFLLLIDHAKVSLLETFLGISISIALAFILSILMDHFKVLYKAMYPILVITQTIPTVAIAPLLVLWLGYDMAPKVVLIVLVCFFPIVISMLQALKSVDQDAKNLLVAMGASKFQVFKHISLPYSIEGLLSGIKISISYSFVGAVIAEWLGGTKGLGVYMMRAKKSYSYDEMFAIIIFIIIISLLLMGIVKIIERRLLSWKYLKEEK